jgi:hypothetical protein
MSFLKKIFPFLFKSESSSVAPSATQSGKKEKQNKTAAPKQDEGGPVVISGYGIVAKNKNARALRKGTRVYVRAILEDGNRLRVRGMAPNGKKVTVTVPRRSLGEFESEGVPEHIAKHYDNHSIFKDEHEAKMKAEALGKH